MTSLWTFPVNKETRQLHGSCQVHVIMN